MGCYRHCVIHHIYPVRTCTTGVKQCCCVCVCVCVCVSAKIIFKNASSRVARALNSMKYNQQNRIGMFMYLTQVKVVLFAVFSHTSYYQFLGSTPL